jgi:hypothetical protein
MDGRESVESVTCCRTTYGCSERRRFRQLNGPMAITESGGRMSIRVTGYDFFSKSCYICVPISHMIQLRAPQCYIFCRNCGLLLITTFPLAALCFQYLGCLEEAYYCGRVVEATGTSNDRNDSHIDRSIDAADDDYDRFTTVSTRLSSLEACAAPIASLW